MPMYLSDLKKGADGKSAYELAVEKGFTGTEQEWLNSLGGSVDMNNVIQLDLEGTDVDNQLYINAVGKAVKTPQSVSNVVSNLYFKDTFDNVKIYSDREYNERMFKIGNLKFVRVGVNTSNSSKMMVEFVSLDLENSTTLKSNQLEITYDDSYTYFSAHYNPLSKLLWIIRKNVVKVVDCSGAEPTLVATLTVNELPTSMNSTHIWKYRYINGYEKNIVFTFGVVDKLCYMKLNDDNTLSYQIVDAVGIDSSNMYNFKYGGKDYIVSSYKRKLFEVAIQSGTVNINTFDLSSIFSLKNAMVIKGNKIFNIYGDFDAGRITYSVLNMDTKEVIRDVYKRLDIAFGTFDGRYFNAFGTHGVIKLTDNEFLVMNEYSTYDFRLAKIVIDDNDNISIENVSARIPITDDSTYKALFGFRANYIELLDDGRILIIVQDRGSRDYYYAVVNATVNTDVDSIKKVDAYKVSVDTDNNKVLAFVPDYKIDENNNIMAGTIIDDYIKTTDKYLLKLMQ